MNIVFRVDASKLIGHGHVYRCLTLADALSRHQAKVEFITRQLSGSLEDLIRRSGYRVHELPFTKNTSGNRTSSRHDNTHKSLDIGIERDWKETARVLQQIGSVDLLVVDHYSIDQSWEGPIRNYCARILVIDDLANRVHDADILVDQTLGRKSEEYTGLLPAGAKILTGSSYVMVRAEFLRWRRLSLARRIEGGPVNRLQVALGGTAPTRAYWTVLEALSNLDNPFKGTTELVLGVNSIIADSLRNSGHKLECRVETCVGVSNMAERMTSAQMAVGAAGTTSWERCCVGLPSIIIVMADNQLGIAKELEAAGAASVAGRFEAISCEPRLLTDALDPLLRDARKLALMSRRAAALVDGNGAERVCEAVL